MITRFNNATLVDVVNCQLLDNMQVVVDGDTIAEVVGKDAGSPGDAEIIDCSGCFLVPGLIDLHTHLIWSGGADPVGVVDEDGLQLSLLRAAANARNTLAHGITCVRDLGSNDNATLALAKAVANGFLPGPRIVSAGCTIIMTGGHDPFWGIAADGEAEIRKAVRTQVMRGAEVIKISATGGVYGRKEGEDVGTSELTRQEIRVACEEAHRFGLRVAAHAISADGIRNCIEAGVDTIEHGHFLDAELLALMKEKGIAWVPTLFVYQRIAEGTGLAPYAVEKARRIVNIHHVAFQQGLESGVSIGCGSDAGSPNTPHGSLLAELESMVALGCEPFQALQSCTITAAEILGLSRERGSIEVGKKADMILVSADPVKDISNLRLLIDVIRNGRFFRS